MRRFGCIVIFLVVCGSESGFVAYGQMIPGPIPQPRPRQAMKLLKVGETAPDWQLTSAEGQAHSLSSYRGRVVVMDFWATWCLPCATVMPRMQKLQEKFANKGVVVFGINSWENGDPRAFMTKQGYSYGLLLNGERIAESYKVTTLPVVYIVGLDGKIIYCHEGEDHKDLSAVIEKHLKAN
jgi:peroxiredoxin